MADPIQIVDCATLDEFWEEMYLALLDLLAGSGIMWPAARRRAGAARKPRAPIRRRRFL